MPPRVGMPRFTARRRPKRQPIAHAERRLSNGFLRHALLIARSLPHLTPLDEVRLAVFRSGAPWGRALGGDSSRRAEMISASPGGQGMTDHIYPYAGSCGMDVLRNGGGGWRRAAPSRAFRVDAGMRGAKAAKRRGQP